MTRVSIARNIQSNIIAVIGLILVLSSVATGQSAEVAPQGQSPYGVAQMREVPLAHVYWHFLIYQHHLDQNAAEREKQGKEGEWLRNYLQAKLGFTDEEYAPIRASSERLAAKIEDLDAKAKTIAASDRGARRNGLIPAGSPPPGLSQLKALTAEREAAINAEIDALNQSLTPEKAAAFKTFLIDRFAQRISAQKLFPNVAPPTPPPGKQALGSNAR